MGSTIVFKVHCFRFNCTKSEVNKSHFHTKYRAFKQTFVIRTDVVYDIKNE